MLLEDKPLSYKPQENKHCFHVGNFFFDSCVEVLDFQSVGNVQQALDSGVRDFLLIPLPPTFSWLPINALTPVPAKEKTHRDLKLVLDSA